MAAGVIGVLVGSVLQDVRRGLPDVAEIETLYGSGEGQEFHPTVLLARDGGKPVFELMTPDAADRRWLALAGGNAESPSPYVVLATIAALDEHFWTGPGFDWRSPLMAVVSGGADPPASTIAERLADLTLLPPGEGSDPGWIIALRRAFLAAELARRYPKSQILEWYLNIAPYGRGSFGIDAAALAYFGKHAFDLTLGEAAALAALPDHAARRPLEDPEVTETVRSGVLDAMVRQGMIEAALARAARAEIVRFKRAGPPLQVLRGFGGYVLRELEDLFGPSFLSLGGMIITTSLDVDLQLQAECVSATHRQRLNGMSPAWVEPAADGSACVAAAMLPPLRPGDIGVNHHVDEVQLMVLDPETGELLSLVGNAEMARPSIHAMKPFVYLTAFSRGYGPGTMILDIPTGEPGAVGQAEGAAYRGPVRMRTAMVGQMPSALQNVIELVGAESVARVVARMGLADEAAGAGARSLEAGRAETALVDLAFAYGTLANRGRMIGRPAGRPVGDKLRPLSILRVEDRSGRVWYEASPEARPVLSAQLAFLMVDVMRDEAARWPFLGKENPLEIGRPIGALATVSSDEEDAVTIGFTPSRVVAVRLAKPAGESMHGVTSLNGATSIWHAVMRYATRSLPPQDWDRPVGVAEAQVCDPSGMLPTRYCPQVVREVFVEGTEPTSFDTLYQPFLVNKETGNLATLFTPIDLVEERIYLVVPPEAAQWALQTGVEQPPSEYDTVVEALPADADVAISAPEMFSVIRGSVTVRGGVTPPGLRYYRLQYGAGLNPTSWTQIGADVSESVESGVLATWPTQGLDGLYTLQLVAVREEGRIETASVAVTVDNQAPEVRLVMPSDGEMIWRRGEDELILQAEVTDNSRIEGADFFVDDERVATLLTAPYSFRWESATMGDHKIRVRAYDAAGNAGWSEAVVITVVR
jgi:membrane peptidoglycan carboxypeptidase